MQPLRVYCILMDKLEFDVAFKMVVGAQRAVPENTMHRTDTARCVPTVFSEKNYSITVISPVNSSVTVSISCSPSVISISPSSVIISSSKLPSLLCSSAARSAPMT